MAELADDDVTREDLCKIKVTVRTADGALQEANLTDALEQVNITEDEDPETVDQWKEVERTVEEVEETVDNENVVISRIVKSKFEKPSGKQVELVFAEAQPGVDADSITTVK